MNIYSCDGGFGGGASDFAGGRGGGYIDKLIKINHQYQQQYLKSHSHSNLNDNAHDQNLEFKIQNQEY